MSSICHKTLKYTHIHTHAHHIMQSCDYISGSWHVCCYNWLPSGLQSCDHHFQFSLLASPESQWGRQQGKLQVKGMEGRWFLLWGAEMELKSSWCRNHQTQEATANYCYGSGDFQFALHPNGKVWSVTGPSSTCKAVTDLEAFGVLYDPMHLEGHDQHIA